MASVAYTGASESGDATDNAPPAAFTFDFEEEAPARSVDWRRIGLIATLTLVVAAAVTALFLLRPRTNFAIDGPGSVLYVVEASVEPSSLPPVTLIVVDSPAQSRWRQSAVRLCGRSAGRELAM